MSFEEEILERFYLLLGVLTPNEIKEVYKNGSEGLSGVSIENNQ